MSSYLLAFVIDQIARKSLAPIRRRVNVWATPAQNKIPWVFAFGTSPLDQLIFMTNISASNIHYQNPPRRSSCDFSSGTPWKTGWYLPRKLFAWGPELTPRIIRRFIAWYRAHELSHPAGSAIWIYHAVVERLVAQQLLQYDGICSNWRSAKLAYVERLHTVVTAAQETVWTAFNRFQAVNHPRWNQHFVRPSNRLC